MKRSEFARFKEIVRTADNTNWIWHAGYLWIDLTIKQCNVIYHILANKGFEINEKGYVLTPSGLGIKYTLQNEEGEKR